MDIAGRIIAQLETERKRQGITYNALAVRMGAKQQAAVQRMLNGQRPHASLEFISRVAEALGRKIVLK